MGKRCLFHLLVHLFGKKPGAAALLLFYLSFTVDGRFQTFGGRAARFLAAGRGEQADEQKKAEGDDAVFFHNKL